MLIGNALALVETNFIGSAFFTLITLKSGWTNARLSACGGIFRACGVVRAVAIGRDLASISFEAVTAAALENYGLNCLIVDGETHATVQAVPGTNVIVAVRSVVHGVDAVAIGFTIVSHFANPSMTVCGKYFEFEYSQILLKKLTQIFTYQRSFLLLLAAQIRYHLVTVNANAFSHQAK